MIRGNRKMREVLSPKKKKKKEISVRGMVLVTDKQ